METKTVTRSSQADMLGQEPAPSKDNMADSSLKEKKILHGRRQQRHSTEIGSEYHRWWVVRQALGFETNEHIAGLLLDGFHGILQHLVVMCGGETYHGQARTLESHDQFLDASLASPPGGIEDVEEFMEYKNAISHYCDSLWKICSQQGSRLQQLDTTSQPVQEFLIRLMGYLRAAKGKSFTINPKKKRVRAGSVPIRNYVDVNSTQINVSKLSTPSCVVPESQSSSVLSASGSILSQGMTRVFVNDQQQGWPTKTGQPSGLDLGKILPPEGHGQVCTSVDADSERKPAVQAVKGNDTFSDAASSSHEDLDKIPNLQPPQVKQFSLDSENSSSHQSSQQQQVVLAFQIVPHELSSPSLHQQSIQRSETEQSSDTQVQEHAVQGTHQQNQNCQDRNRSLGQWWKKSDESNDIGPGCRSQDTRNVRSSSLVTMDKSGRELDKLLAGPLNILSCLNEETNDPLTDTRDNDQTSLGPSSGTSSVFNRDSKSFETNVHTGQHSEVTTRDQSLLTHSLLTQSKGSIGQHTDGSKMTNKGQSLQTNTSVTAPRHIVSDEVTARGQSLMTNIDTSKQKAQEPQNLGRSTSFFSDFNLSNPPYAGEVRAQKVLGSPSIQAIQPALFPGLDKASLGTPVILYPANSFSSNDNSLASLSSLVHNIVYNSYGTIIKPLSSPTYSTPLVSPLSSTSDNSSQRKPIAAALPVLSSQLSAGKPTLLPFYFSHASIGNLPKCTNLPGLPSGIDMLAGSQVTAQQEKVPSSNPASLPQKITRGVPNTSPLNQVKVTDVRSCTSSEFCSMGQYRTQSLSLASNCGLGEVVGSQNFSESTDQVKHSLYGSIEAEVSLSSCVLSSSHYTQDVQASKTRVSQLGPNTNKILSSLLAGSQTSVGTSTSQADSTTHVTSLLSKEASAQRFSEENTTEQKVKTALRTSLTRSSHRRRLVCSICDRLFYSSMDLLVHRFDEHGHVCGECDGRFLTLAQLRQHKKTDHPPVLMCTHCRFLTFEREILADHSWSEHGIIINSKVGGVLDKGESHKKSRSLQPHTLCDSILSSVIQQKLPSGLDSSTKWSGESVHGEANSCPKLEDSRPGRVEVFPKVGVTGRQEFLKSFDDGDLSLLHDEEASCGPVFPSFTRDITASVPRPDLDAISAMYTQVSQHCHLESTDFLQVCEHQLSESDESQLVIDTESSCSKEMIDAESSCTKEVIDAESSCTKEMIETESSCRREAYHEHSTHDHEMLVHSQPECLNKGGRDDVERVCQSASDDLTQDSHSKSEPYRENLLSNSTHITEDGINHSPQKVASLECESTDSLHHQDQQGEGQDKVTGAARDVMKICVKQMSTTSGYDGQSCRKKSTRNNSREDDVTLYTDVEIDNPEKEGHEDGFYLSNSFLSQAHDSTSDSCNQDSVCQPPKDNISLQQISLECPDQIKPAYKQTKQDDINHQQKQKGNKLVKLFDTARDSCQSCETSVMLSLQERHVMSSLPPKKRKLKRSPRPGRDLDLPSVSDGSDKTCPQTDPPVDTNIPVSTRSLEKKHGLKFEVGEKRKASLSQVAQGEKTECLKRINSSVEHGARALSQVTKQPGSLSARAGFVSPVSGYGVRYCRRWSTDNCLSKVHAKNSQMTCSVAGCDFKFSSKRELRQHVTVDHMGKTRKYTCSWPECSKRFFARTHLSIHMLTHTGEKPVACDICDYRCRQRTALIWHMRKHGVFHKVKKVNTHRSYV